MQKLVEDFPTHLKEAIKIGNAANLKETGFKAVNVLISGLGGSGIGGKVVAQLVSESCKVPIAVNNDYALPEWVDSKTLVIISSYSGDTEETVAALHSAIERGAHVVCVTSGGKIGAEAVAKGFNHILIPGGNPPRAMFGYSSVQLFYVLHHYQLIDGSFEEQILKVSDDLQKGQKDIIDSSLELAKKIQGRIPILYSDALYEGVAIRWRQQINENSKMLCWHHFFPEMNHNELVGWSGGDNRVAVVLMRSEDDHERSKIRMEICKKLMGQYCDTIEDVWSKGGNRVERSYYHVHFGDWLSIHLANLNGVDAVAIPAIIFLKAELAKI
ncbi:MAG: bifunctional phosphoglucose/phosphomannose isomerase [Flavobacteriales bacterium]|nr:bifunctional phosphoglucose/phosphomannose isomerase [Flavobacteriales bacterium]